MVLETERLILRPWSEDDAQELYKYASDPRVGPAAGWAPHTSVENSREIIRGVLSEPETYAVVLKNTMLPIGSVGIMRMRNGSAPMTDDEAEIGYWIGVPYWGKGMIPEAVRILQARCFEYFNCKTVWCGYYDGNEKSKRVQEKCGFVYHHSKRMPCPLGDERTEHFTRITREEWLAKQSRHTYIESIHNQVAGLMAHDTNFAHECMQALEAESTVSDAVYSYFDTFVSMLDIDNSFIRMRGLSLISANARWDVDNKLDVIISKYLMHIEDKKPIAARICIQALPQIAKFKPALRNRILQALYNASPDGYADSMQPLIQKDIAEATATIEAMKH